LVLLLSRVAFLFFIVLVGLFSQLASPYCDPDQIVTPVLLLDKKFGDTDAELFSRMGGRGL